MERVDGRTALRRVWLAGSVNSSLVKTERIGNETAARPTWHQMVDAERDGAEMVEPAAKRLCSTVASVVRRVAVEGNIGEGESGKYCMRISNCCVCN